MRGEGWMGGGTGDEGSRMRRNFGRKGREDVKGRVRVDQSECRRIIVENISQVTFWWSIITRTLTVRRQ